MPPARPRASAVPATLMLCCAAACQAVVIGAAATSRQPGLLPAGAALTWLPIAMVVLLGGARGWMPRWAVLACCLVVPLSGWAAWRCAVLAGSGAAAPAWAVPVLAALPIPLVSYAFWAHFPVLHRALPATPVSLAAMAAALALAGTPYAADRLRALPPDHQTPQPAPPQPAGTVGAAAGRSAAPRSSTGIGAGIGAGLAGEVARLTPDSPLSAYVPLFVAGGKARQEAIARARLLDTRQADAEALVARGVGLDPAIADLSLLDLAATPALCRSFADHLEQEAGQDRGREGFSVVSDRLEPQLENINWLAGAKCDLAAALAAVQTTVQGYPASPERERLLDAIGALLSGGPIARAGDPALCLGAAPAAVTDRIAGCTAIVRGGRAGFGRLRATLVSRGTLRYAAADYRGAAADYGAALRLPPQDPRVLVNLGNAYEAAGDHPAALRSYDAAIAIDPDSALAFNNRGAAQEAHGDHARAAADLDVAVKLDPGYATALANRGRARYFLGDMAESAGDFDAVLKLRPDDARAMLWRHLAARRGRLAVAADLRRDAAALDRAAWPWPLVAVFLGDRDIPSGEQAALNADPAVQARQSCEADFYLGALRAADAALPEARALLGQAVRACPSTAVEGQAAAAELLRLGK